MLGLGFPGGPAVARAAEQGDPAAHRFPRTFLNEPDRLAFSFSGLKTAVRYQVVGQGERDFSQLVLDPQQIADLCASFQEAVVDTLVGKSLHALDHTGLKTLCVGGGVAANRRLRERLTTEMAARDVRLIIAPPELCTDNAVMGAIAVERAKAGLFETLDLDIQPGLVR
jgi:N6-L-threonylcarbamoyladenine synthase